MADRSHGRGIPPTQVKTILSSDYHPPVPATPQGADPDVDKFRTVLLSILLDANGQSKHRVGRRLYLVFAGYGFQGNSTWEEAALYTANSIPYSPAYIAGTQYANQSSAYL